MIIYILIFIKIKFRHKIIFSSSFSSPPRPWCFFLLPNVSTTQAPSQDVVLKRFFLKGAKTEQDNGQGEDNFHAFFLLLLPLSSPGGFFIHDTLSQKENAKWRITVDTRVCSNCFSETQKQERKTITFNFPPTHPAS